MSAVVTLRRNAFLLSVAPLFAFPSLVDSCNEPPPCTDVPESLMGSFDGVLYDPNSGGQMYADRSDVCINVSGAVTYQSNIDYMQTIVMMDTVQGVDLYYIYFADFKNPIPYWEGGVELVVKVQSAIDSARYDTPIPLDGVDALGYYWTDNFWDRYPVPGYVTSSGSITFSVASKVPGGMTDADFSGGVIPYQAARTTSSGVDPLAPRIPPATRSAGSN